MKLAIVQTKPRKGALEMNLAEAGEALVQLHDDPPDLVVFPEAAFTGYFLEGAVYELSRSARWFADRFASYWFSNGPKPPLDVVCGFYENDAGTYYNSSLYASLKDGRAEVLAVHRKMFLPTYGVFDEERFISRGRRLGVLETRFGKTAMLICEDAWHSIMPTIAAIKGAQIMIIPSASPGRGIAGENGELESVAHWRNLMRAIASEHGVYVLYAGLAGFEGGKGMTGSSAVIDPFGGIVVKAPALGACILRAEIDLNAVALARASLPLLGDLNAVLPDLLLDDELPLPRRGLT